VGRTALLAETAWEAEARGKEAGAREVWAEVAGWAKVGALEATTADWVGTAAERGSEWAEAAVGEGKPLARAGTEATEVDPGSEEERAHREAGWEGAALMAG